MEKVEKLITKAGAAELMSVSLRTIDNWISNGTLPMPTTIGRRVYWHPADFALWQDQVFGRDLRLATAARSSQQRPRGRPRTVFAAK